MTSHQNFSPFRVTSLTRTWQTLKKADLVFFLDVMFEFHFLFYLPGTVGSRKVAGDVTNHGMSVSGLSILTSSRNPCLMIRAPPTHTKYLDLNQIFQIFKDQIFPSLFSIRCLFNDTCGVHPDQIFRSQSRFAVTHCIIKSPF